ncbi:hypothetical protein HO173_009597 [Letharia columbiana]|uniref:Uncharacterized protein n=1 Tax=Letharia columbiana TaxID=112416 RepID=A0A8H6FPB4_9LECA|nr:uncharacterized protein HO173_009597 [Letharia columbiana]KAF6232214.1 hypothetical protein HO173_009597 [Letharia columbiana]
MQSPAPLPSAPATTPTPFQTLRQDPTFANLLRALPTALTSSLFMTFGLLGAVLACLKWALFIVIIVVTFGLGLAILVVAAALLGAGLVGLARGLVAAAKE